MTHRPAHRPIVLAILDGWGYSETAEHNAIHAASTPNWDRLWNENPHGCIDTSGIAVGLPGGQMGNSEVGHLNLGAGRVIYQDVTRISKAIDDGDFFENAELLAAVDAAKSADGIVHVIGLLSPGGVHALDEHLFAMVRLAAKRGATVHVHALLDGRDMPPRSAEASLEKMQAVCRDAGNARIASMIGRYFAMDRDNRWDRVQQAYELLSEARGEFRADDALAGLKAAYERGENDEFVKATVIGEFAGIKDGDSIVFMNFRADRARELTQAFTQDDFDGFERRARPQLSRFVCLTEYRKDFGLPVAFGPSRPQNVLGEYLSNLGLKQLRIAETEKYAHVTFFFNGGEETPYPGEDRELIPSPRVATYDLKPEMSAPEVTDKLNAAIASGKYDFIVVNYANADMVGHSGKFDAAVAAVEALDACIGRLAGAVEKAGGELLITADHGNVEQMYDDATGQAHTAHTTNLVPLLYVGRDAGISNGGALSDIAPTVLTLMGIPVPGEMTGKPLVELHKATA
ncbi:MAG TPA: 2,3-bisphosphoglycerate-independent phosphoglycerate mutase [Gammaproteobacteria bacterium]